MRPRPIRVALRYLKYDEEAARAGVEAIAQKGRGVITLWLQSGELEPGMHGDAGRTMQISLMPRSLSVFNASALHPQLRKALVHLVKLNPSIAERKLSLDAGDEFGSVGAFLERTTKDHDTLLKVERGIMLYHGTSSALWPMIQKKGLRPRRMSGAEPTYGATQGAKPGDERLVYLATDSAMNAAHFAARDAVAKLGGDGIVIGVNSRNLDPARLYPDEDSGYRSSWEKSLQRLGTVAYMGVISPTKLIPIERLSDRQWGPWDGIL